MKKPVSFKQKILLFIFLPLSVISNFAMWDHWRLEKNFGNLFVMLNNARMDALHRNIEVIVSLDGNQVVSNNSLGEEPVTATIPTISRVDYNTTLGDNMVVFGHLGTTEMYNKRINGGEITLKSILGFKKHIHINSNGLVRESRYSGI